MAATLTERCSPIPDAVSQDVYDLGARASDTFVFSVLWHRRACLSSERLSSRVSSGFVESRSRNRLIHCRDLAHLTKLAFDADTIVGGSQRVPISVALNPNSNGLSVGIL